MHAKHIAAALLALLALATASPATGLAGPALGQFEKPNPINTY